jgi:hypothetical protein
MNKTAILHTILIVVIWLMTMVPNSSFDNEQQITDGEPTYTSVCYLNDIDKTTDKYLWAVPQRCLQLILSQQLLSDGELTILFRSLLPRTQAPQADTDRGRVSRSSTVTPQQQQQQQKPHAQLTLLDISWNSMRSDATQSLVQYIVSNPSIEYLYLGQNPLSEKDLILIADGLRTRDFKKNLHVYMEGLHITDAVATALQKALEKNLYLVYLALDNAYLTDAGSKILHDAVTMRLRSVHVSHKKLVLCELQVLKDIMGRDEDEKSVLYSLEKETARFRASVRRKQAPIELSNYANMNTSAIEVLRMCFGADKERVLLELMKEYDKPSEMELTVALDEFVALLLPLQIESIRTLLCLCDELSIRLNPDETSFPSVCSSSDLNKMRAVVEEEINTEGNRDYEKIMKSFDWDIATNLGITFSSEQDLLNQELNEHPVMPSPRFDVRYDL